MSLKADEKLNRDERQVRLLGRWCLEALKRMLEDELGQS